MYKLIIIAILFFLNANLSFASSNNAYISKQNNNLNAQKYNIFVPAKTTCEAVLSTEISSQTAIIGQTVTAILTKDFIYKNNLIASAGSMANGTIVLNKKPTQEQNAQMQIRFTTIRTPYNNLIPINATFLFEDDTTLNKDDKITKEQILIPANSPIKLYFNQPITVGAK